VNAPSNVVDWIAAGDPALRWQALRDLTDTDPASVAAVRARVAHDGWGARLLAARDPDGRWAGGACFPADFTGDFSAGQPWTATLPTLGLLRDFGIDPAEPAVAETIELIGRNCRWEHAGQPFFAGEVEPCINGRTVAIGAYFGVDVSGIVDRLLGEQLDDGGWNCEAENGSRRSSFDSTICVLDGLLEFERNGGGSSAVRDAREWGAEYLLARRLFRRLSTGAVGNPEWRHFAFPTWWHYDVLRGLDYFRAVGGTPDPRLDEAVGLVRDRRGSDGRWPLDRSYPGAVHLRMEGPDGQPSRWNTLRALRVLAWWDGG
jgi:hypothetical protein